MNLDEALIEIDRLLKANREMKECGDKLAVHAIDNLFIKKNVFSFGVKRTLKEWKKVSSGS